MKTIRFFAVVILIFSSCFFSKAQTVTEKIATVDNEVLAHKIINQCANIHESEMVLITGGVRDIELLENIAVNVRRLGAFPLISIGSDRLTRRMYTDVPAKYDSQVPGLDLKLFSFITTAIRVDYNEIPGLLSDIPPERLVASIKATEPVVEISVNRKVKGVSLGNGLYPTEANAKQYGISQKELSDIFWNGVNVDYLKLESTGNVVKKLLSDGKEIQITNANGTNIKMRIENRQVFVSDGSLSDDDLQGGFAAAQVYLPAGEVFLAPVPGTAEGKIVVDRLFYQDKEIIGLTMTFQNGKLTSMTARTGIEPLRALYDAAEPGKEVLGFVDFGINPEIKIKPGSKLVAWMPEGMVTMGIGNNIWAGGEIKNSFGLPFFLPGCTVKIDGKVLVENGNLKY